MNKHDQNMCFCLKKTISDIIRVFAEIPDARPEGFVESFRACVGPIGSYTLVLFKVIFLVWALLRYLFWD